MNCTLVVFLFFFIYTASVSESKCPCAEKNCQHVHESTCKCQLGWFGSSCQMQNIALGKPTNQSSTYGGLFYSYLAVDGNTSSNIARGKSCTFTSPSAPPPTQWTVYLQGAFNISHIKIFLSNNDAAARNGFKVYVGDTLCYLPNKTFRKEAILDVNCTNPIRGTSLSVKIDGTLLSLCEVQVFVCSDGWFGENCNYQCHCGNMTEVCDKVNGYCRSGCTAGKHGPGCLTNCGDYTYDDNCTGVCKCLNQCEVCNSVTGACNTGQHTTSAPSRQHSKHGEQNDFYPVVLGIVVGVLCILITVLIVVIVRLKRQVNQYKTEKEQHYISLGDRTDSSVYDVISGFHPYVNEDANAT